MRTMETGMRIRDTGRCLLMAMLLMVTMNGHAQQTDPALTAAVTAQTFTLSYRHRGSTVKAASCNRAKGAGLYGQRDRTDAEPLSGEANNGAGHGGDTKEYQCCDECLQGTSERNRHRIGRFR